MFVFNFLKFIGIKNILLIRFMTACILFSSILSCFREPNDIMFFLMQF